MPPRATRRARLALVAIALALPVGATVPSAWVAGAATTPPLQPERPDPQAYRALAAEVTRHTNRLAELAGAIEQANARVATLDAEIGVTKQRLDATQNEITRYRTIIRDRAAFIYRHARAPQSILDIRHIEQVSSGEQYARSATKVDTTRIAELTEIANSLQAHLRELQSTRDSEATARDDLVSEQAQLQTVVERERALLDAAGAITVMGDSTVTAEQITAWFEARGVRYRLSQGTTIADLASMFIEEGQAEHVRGDIAFAQSVLETGSFGSALDNNYGGIGACDSCKGEIAFPTPRDGVRGQIQMLRNYADPASRAANLANPPSPGIYGRDPAAAAVAYDTFFAKGRVPTWNLMGNGNWATAPDYAPKVLGIYFEMAAFASRRD